MPSRRESPLWLELPGFFFFPQENSEKYVFLLKKNAHFETLETSPKKFKRYFSQYKCIFRLGPGLSFGVEERFSNRTRRHNLPQQEQNTDCGAPPLASLSQHFWGDVLLTGSQEMLMQLVWGSHSKILCCCHYWGSSLPLCPPLLPTPVLLAAQKGPSVSLNSVCDLSLAKAGLQDIVKIGAQGSNSWTLIS